MQAINEISCEEIEPNIPHLNPQSNLECDFSDFDSDFGDVSLAFILCVCSKLVIKNTTYERKSRSWIYKFHIFQEDDDDLFDIDDPEVMLIDMGYSHEEASAAVKRCGAFLFHYLLFCLSLFYVYKQDP